MNTPARINGITALYERLSRDDDVAGESNSILNQKKYLEDYARQNGFANVRHYSDDGYTGTNFNRPGFIQMMNDIDEGLISTVIVKDMSRFGRNYLEVGLYTEITFPEKGIRFIAINSNVDSANPTENEFTPFLNVINDWYAKDTSRKICAIFKSRMSEGLRCSGSVPFGYTRLSGDKQKLVIDEKAAEVVRRIFDMAAAGVNPPGIATILTNEKVLLPSAYAAKYHPEAIHSRNYTDPCLWSPHSVSMILDREEYLGHTILGKTVRISFRSKKRRATTPSERLFFPNTHEPIIDQSTWDQAQKLRKRCTRRRPSGTHTHMLFGLTYCADCGAKMAVVRNGSGGKEYNYSFRCRNYRSLYRECTGHATSANILTEVIRLSLKVIAKDALEDEQAFRTKLNQQWAEKHSQAVAECRKELSTVNKRIDELDELIRSLYEDKRLRRIPERQAERLITQYDQEQETLEKRSQELQKQIDDEKAGKTDPDRFIKAIRKYCDFDTLTQEMVFELIERIDVHQAKKNDETGERTQQIDISFSFIGHYSPDPDCMAYEIAQIHERKKAEKAERQRTNYVRNREKEHERRIQRKIEREKLAETDPEVAAHLAAEKAKRKEYSKAYHQKKKEQAIQEAIANGTYVPPNTLHTMTQKKLAEIADTDPEAAAELEKRRAYGRAKQADYRAKSRERAQSDPEYAAHVKARAAKANEKRKAKYDDLVERAQTDPAAAEELAELTMRRRGYAKACEERKKQRAAEDPVYAEEYKAEIREKYRKHNERERQKRQDLKTRAETDPQAAAELAELRAAQVDASTRSRKKLDEAAKTDPSAAAVREQHLQHKREYYRQRHQELITAAQTDPIAAERLAQKRRKAVEVTQRYQAKKKAATAAI